MTPADNRSKLESSTWFAVVQAYLTCAQQYGRMLRQFDITVAQFDALSALQSLGDEASPSAIAERLLVSRANVSGLLKRLREQSRIAMRAHEADARAQVCRLTPEGTRLLAVAQAGANRFIEAQLKPFASGDLQQLRSLMQQMKVHLQTLDPDALAGAQQQDTMEIA